MSEIVEFIKAHNAMYVQQEGAQQRLFQNLFRTTPEYFVSNEPGILLQTAPTVDISHFWSYAIERLRICPIEQADDFAGLLGRALKLPKNRIPAITYSLGSLHDYLAEDDPSIARTVLVSGLNRLSDKDLLTMLASGAPAYKPGAGRANRESLSPGYCEVLEQFLEADRPGLLAKAPANTSMAIYKRLGWARALERAGSESRDKVFAGDLGL